MSQGRSEHSWGTEKCIARTGIQFVQLAESGGNSRGLKKWFKGRLVGLFQHFIRRLIVLLSPYEFLHSSPEAPRTIQVRETSASEGRNYYQGI